MNPKLWISTALLSSSLFVASRGDAGTDADGFLLASSPRATVTSPSGAVAGETERPVDPPPDDIGGDDQLVLSYPTVAPTHGYAMDIAETGDIYAAVEAVVANTGAEIRVLRSEDGGDTWVLWGLLSDPNATRAYHQPSLHVAEGNQNRLYLAYQYENGAADRIIDVAYSDLGLPSAVFTVHTALSQPGVDFQFADLSSDEMNSNAYRLFLVAEGDDGNGNDIWFTRSIDFGGSWEPEYPIASLGSGDRDYRWPKVRYGVGGVVHCVWEFDIRGDSDSAIRYRRALNYANAGSGDWQPGVQITSTTDGRSDTDPSIAAAHVSNKVLIGYEDPSGGAAEAQLRQSNDAGATWPSTLTADLPIGAYGPELLALPLGLGFRIAGYVGDGLHGVFSSTEAAPLSLSPPSVYTDHQYYGPPVPNPDVSFDYDASRGHRLGWVWPSLFFDPDEIYFDAEWRSDPGYPNLEPGFPLALDAGAVAHPALVNLDDDLDLEIVFGDDAGFVQVFDPDGTVVPGWPVDIGDFPPTYPRPGGYPTANCAVAIDDLDGDGLAEVVAGNDAGRVWALRSDGTSMPGWPVALGSGEDAFVSIGSVVGASRRQVVACAGTRIHLLLPDGTESPGFPVNVGGVLTAPAAIGDLDNDGEVDIVAVGGDELNWYDATGRWRFRFTLAPGRVFSGQVSLGDLDLDGDLEIAAVTSDGFLKVLHHTGDYLFSVQDASQTYLPSAALANVIGTFEPDVAFASREWAVHLLLSDGSEAAGWPHGTSPNYFLIGPPIMDTLDEGSPDVVIGSRDGLGYGWNNLFDSVPGWPKDLPGQCNVSPASGDIDQDGILEVVFVTSSHLIVLDTGGRIDRADPRGQWPMYGCNPARTACLDCPDGPASGVPDGVRPVQSALRAISQNPFTSSIRLRFDLVDSAPIRVAVYDSSGRLIRELLRAELEPGGHEVEWNGEDATGRAVAAGVYFCRLNAGSDESVTRLLRVRGSDRRAR